MAGGTDNTSFHISIKRDAYKRLAEIAKSKELSVPQYAKMRIMEAVAEEERRAIRSAVLGDGG